METACASTSKTAFKPGNQNYVSSGRPWDGQALPAAAGSLLPPGIKGPEPQALWESVFLQPLSPGQRAFELGGLAAGL